MGNEKSVADRRRFGLRLTIFGLGFVFVAPLIMLFPEASELTNRFGLIWAVGMSEACGITLLLLGLAMRESSGKHQA